MNRLDEYFESGRNRRREVSSEQLRGFLAKHADMPEQENHDRHDPGGTMKIIAIIATAATIGFGVIDTFVRESEPVAPQPEPTAAEAPPTGRPTVIETSSCPGGEIPGREGRTRSAMAPEALEGIAMLTLTDTELARIGIRRMEEPGIVLYIADNRWGQVTTTTIGKGSADDFPTINTPLPEGIDPLPFQPRLVTDDLGRMWRFAYTYEEIDRALADSIAGVQKRFSYLSDKGRVHEAVDSMNRTEMPKWFDELHRRSRSLIDFDRLIPIHVPARNPGNADKRPGSCRPDIIVWFDATPELVRLLPPDWKERLEERGGVGAGVRGRRRDGGMARRRDEKGMGVVRDSMVHEREVVQSRGGLGEEAMTGGAVMPVGAIDSVELQPNPVSGAGSLRLVLNADRTVVVSLHTVQGERIALLVSDQRLEAGERQLTLSFADIPAGIYLLVATTDRNEVVVQRVMVRSS